MKAVKSIFAVLLISFIMFSFSQCSGVKKLQEEAPMAMETVYFQKWVAGVKGGGAGLNLFIPASNSSVILDSVYFRGKVAKLETKSQDKLLYIGRFKRDVNQKKDVIKRNDPKDENGNTVTQAQERMPFPLKDNECIISYKEGKNTRYFKVGNIVEKNMTPYPSAIPNKNKQ